jgi:hypothetical protein
MEARHTLEKSKTEEVGDDAILSAQLLGAQCDAVRKKLKSLKYIRSHNSFESLSVCAPLWFSCSE